MSRELKSSIIRREEEWPKQFGLTEAEVLEIMEAAAKYNGSNESYNDWAEMYWGIHRESASECAYRNWFACIRWMKRRESKLSQE